MVMAAINMIQSKNITDTSLLRDELQTKVGPLFIFSGEKLIAQLRAEKIGKCLLIRYLRIYRLLPIELKLSLYQR